MGFYKSIANYYDLIFPLNNDQVDFVVEKLPNIKSLDLLDIGCGTGGLTHALGEICHSVVGIDLDEEMLKLAAAKVENKNIKFLPCDMLRLAHEFKNESFDAIICFGNTLVHLDNLEEMGLFLSQSFDLLKKGGKLFIQIINYDRILNDEIDALPTIENSNLKFTRNYFYIPNDHRINFSTELLIKNQCNIIENEQFLYPLRQKELCKLLENAGFDIISKRGGFKTENLNFNSIPFIIEVIKP